MVTHLQADVVCTCINTVRARACDVPLWEHPKIEGAERVKPRVHGTSTRLRTEKLSTMRIRVSRFVVSVAEHVRHEGRVILNVVHECAADHTAIRIKVVGIQGSRSSIRTLLEWLC